MDTLAAAQQMPPIRMFCNPRGGPGIGRFTLRPPAALDRTRLTTPIPQLRETAAWRVCAA